VTRRCTLQACLRVVDPGRKYAEPSMGRVVHHQPECAAAAPAVR
jgi:predicted GNAT family N-acyltransferase